MARQSKKKPPAPSPVERKARAHVYLTPATLAALVEIAEEQPGLSNRNGAIEYLVALHASIKAAREARGLKGPVPLQDPDGRE